MPQNAYMIPGAIIAAGILLAVSLYYVRSNDRPTDQEQAKTVRPVSVEDHILGDPRAEVIVVEYSDIDCEYCKDFQKTMMQIMTEYGVEGNVAWVYRHLPLSSVNAYSRKHAEAAECVASLSGNEKFFRFIDLLQSRAPGEQQFNSDDYSSVLAQLGISEQAFQDCFSKGTFSLRVQEDAENAVAAGAAGAPFTVLMIQGKDPVPVSGALPYDAMKKVLEEGLLQARQAK